MSVSSGTSTARRIEPDIGKIAVLRANALGDLIFTLPALGALRSAYPEAEIVLLARGWHRDLLSGRPGPVDRVLPIPPARGLTVRPEEPETAEMRGEQERFFAAMVAERFDLAVQLHGGGRHSNPFLLHLGARLSIGLKTADADALDRWVPYIYYQHEVLRCLEVVALVGAAATAIEPVLCVTEADLAEAANAMLGILPDSEARRIVALHPGATDPRRRWPVQKFAAAGDALARVGATVVVTGIDSELEIVEAVLAAMEMPCTNLCGRLSIGGLAGLFSRCAVVISNDTGPLHLAAAVGAATTGIYWCGNLINAGSATRTRHRPAISWRLNCPVCGVNCTQQECDHAASFVDIVSVDEVVTSALDLFQRP